MLLNDSHFKLVPSKAVHVIKVILHLTKIDPYLEICITKNRMQIIFLYGVLHCTSHNIDSCM